MASADTGATMISDSRMWIQEPSKSFYVFIINVSDIVIAKMAVFHK